MYSYKFLLDKSFSKAFIVDNTKLLSSSVTTLISKGFNPFDFCCEDFNFSNYFNKDMLTFFFFESVLSKCRSIALLTELKRSIAIGFADNQWHHNQKLS
jgi:hypothetical protein